MNNIFSKLRCTAIILAGASAALVPAMASADWTIKGLGTLGGPTSTSSATGINFSGQVVGTSYTPGDPGVRAFVTSGNGEGMTGFGPLATVPININDRGQIVGISRINLPDPTYAFITGAGGPGMFMAGAPDLDTLGVIQSIANDINDYGQVVGAASTVPGSFLAFITGPDGVGMRVLGTLGEDIHSDALGINFFGEVVGYSDTPGKTGAHAFITGPNGIGMTSLGTLGGAINEPHDINYFGQVVGSSSIAGPGTTAMHAYVTGDHAAGMIDLGTLGGKNSVALGITDFGQVVGNSEFSDSSAQHGFLYSNGVMTDLSQLASVRAAGWTDLTVAGISESGQIAGSGVHDGIFQAFLLSPGAGSTLANPILPIANLPVGWQFEFTPNGGTTYIDPQVATGYDYILDSGPNFSSVLLPSVGDGEFALYLWNGTAWMFDSTLTAGVEHSFGGVGVDRFRIEGIETSAGLDPNSPTAFITGLHFAGAAAASMHMVPIAQDVNVVTEPGVFAMVLTGFGLMGFIARRGKRNTQADLAFQAVPL